MLHLASPGDAGILPAAVARERDPPAIERCGFQPRNAYPIAGVCKCPYGISTFTRKKRLAELVGVQLSVRFALPSTV